MAPKHDELILVKPNRGHARAYKHFIAEWEASEPGQHLVPGALNPKGLSYEAWLERIQKNANPSDEDLAPNLVPSDLYFLMNETDAIDGADIFGAIDIRHYLNDALMQKGGHVGYGVGAAYRGEGLATKMLALGLKKCKELGLTRVLVTCDQSNLASAKTIMRCGGILENEWQEENGNIVQRYWIKIN